MMPAIRAVLFDKDGTLFDFNATWSAWAKAVLLELAGGRVPQAATLARAIGFDLAAGRFDPASPVIAGTPEEAAGCLLPHLPGWRHEALVTRLVEAAEGVPLVPAARLPQLMGGLRAMGLVLGVVTNDAEAVARAHLAAAGVAQAFAYVAGYDTGFGAKPDPGPCLAFCDRHGIAPGAVLMVGDSRHDLLAARAAGMRGVGVLTGPASRAELAPLAEAVLPDIGALPGWLTAAHA